MKQTTRALFSGFLKSNAGRLGKALLFSAGIFSMPLGAQLSYSFTTAGATGSVGPTQAQLNTAYASTNLSGQVTAAAGIQSWVVPATGLYRISVAGASGGSTNDNTRPIWTGGLGARMQGEISLTAGDVVKVVVGQMGIDGNGSGGGGGATYIVVNNVALIAAGGGGGASSTTNGVNAVTVTAGTSDLPASTNLPGTGGNGGGACSGSSGMYNAGGGGGFNSGTAGDGATPNSGGGGGKSFLNGSSGGSGNKPGGFGGGGAGHGNYSGGGGGGGYSGGVGGNLATGDCGAGSSQTAGGGGGSINSGANQVNAVGTGTGNGFAILTSLCNVTVTGTSSLICTGTSVTLTTNAISNYTWSTGNTTSSVIVVSPTTTTTYTVGGTGTIPSGCVASAIITVTVNNTPTVSINSTTLSACLGQTVGLTAGGANTYTWSGGLGNNAAITVTLSANTGYTVSGTNACGTASAAVTVTVSALPVLVSTSSATVCAAAATTLNAGGATTYTWMPGNSTQTNYIVNPTANTVYTVTGKTGSCLGTNTIAIYTKPNPTITIVATATAVCDGDVASLTANGGDTYTWNPVVSSNTTIAVSPTVSTLYSVVGINSVNCTSSAAQVIVVRARPVINVTASNPVVCPDGSSTLTATGTSTGYVWSNTATSSTTIIHTGVTATYSVTGTTSANCSGTATITVSVFDPTLTVSSNTAVCRGTNVNLSASGADAYHWSTGSAFSSISVTPTITTTYTVGGSSTQGLVTCLDTAQVIITVNPNPTVTAAASPTYICRGLSSVITASGAATYTWAAPASTVAPSITVSPTADQSYTLSGEDVNGCKGTGSVLVRVSPCPGIAGNVLNTANLSIYPNPSNGDFMIRSDQAIDLQVINELGQQVRTISLSNTNKEIKITNLASGIYFITGKNENGDVKQKIIINR